MVKYYVTEQKVFSRENGDYISYGLKVTGDNGKESIVSDLSLSKRCVENFCRLLNYYNIKPEKLYEYIEDFLSDEEYYL